MLSQTYNSPFLGQRKRIVSHLKFLPAPAAKRTLLDPVAFFLALIGAPLVVAALGFWALLIPVFAVIYGGPYYLIIGAPLLLWFVPRNGVQPRQIAILAFVANGVATLAAILALGLTEWQHIPLGVVLWFGTFGSIFALLWGRMFAHLYLRFESKFYRAANGRMS